MDNFKCSQRDSGNVLFLILIAVALFAALSYAVTQSTRGGGNADDESSLIKSASLTQYVATIKTAIMRLRINGCGEDGISFHHTSWGHADYQHTPSASTDCQIFHQDGGGVSWQTPPDDITTLEWEFVGEARVHGIGTTDLTDDSVDLVLALPGISEAMCLKINEELGYDFGGVVPVDSGDLFDGSDTRFDGDYVAADNITGPNNGCPDDLCYKETACFRESAGNEYYIYYDVLIAR